MSAYRSGLKQVWWACSLSLLVIVLQGAAFAQYTFTAIDYPGSIQTECNDVFAGGNIVGTYVDSQGGTHGFLYGTRINEFQKIDFPGARNTVLYGIRLFSQVGWYLDASGVTHGLSRISSGFATIDPPGSILTTAWSINYSYNVVGTFKDSAGVSHGFLLNDGGQQYSTIDFPNAASTGLTGINQQGQMAGIYIDAAGKQHGFATDKGKFVTIDYPGAAITGVNRINRNDEVVGFYSSVVNGPLKGFTLLNGHFHTVMYPGSIETNVRGVDDFGNIVGRYVDSNGAVHGFIGTR